MTTLQPRLPFLPWRSPTKRHPKPTTTRRHHKTTTPPPSWMVLACAIVGTILLLWIIGFLIVYLCLHRHHSVSPFVIPEHLLDLWPDNDNNIAHDYDLVYASCLPQQDTSCVVRTKADEKEQRIGIVRSPGVLGSAFETFVRDTVEKRLTDDDKDTTTMLPPITLQATSHVSVDPDHSFAKLIRPAIFPVLLEALDLCLATLDVPRKDEDDNPFASRQQQYSTISLMDIVHVVRILMRWHCRISQFALNDHTALYTASFATLTAFPMTTQRQLAAFLEFSVDKQPNDDDFDRVATKILQRVDDCNDFLLTRFRDTQKELEDGVVAAIGEEASCETLHFGDSSSTTLRVSELVGSALDASRTTLDMACAKYPNAVLCQKDGTTATGR